MNILIPICARGGSKGVKNKNIRELAGKPLIAYTIDTAKKWGKADKIICSTDSKEIADIAQKYGIEVPFMRPKELATDSSGKIPAVRHALIECEKIYGKKYDIVVDLDVTSPIRTENDLDNCLKVFLEKDADFLLSAVEARKNPYFNMLELSEDGFAEVSKKLPQSFVRRQDAPKVYSANASIYFHKRDFLLDKRSNFPLKSKKMALYVMDETASVDIDTEIDFKFVEFLIEKRVVKL